MRTTLLALTIGCAAQTLAAMPASAAELPYCIKGCDFGGSSGRGDCSFTSYQQCQATLSGRAGTCDVNPYFNARAQMPADGSRMSRRKL